MNDPMIKEMEAAYETIKDARKSEEKNEAVTRVVQKYFPPGMEVEVALKQLHEKGFEISEYRYDGARSWPDGEFKPWDEELRRNIQSRYRKDQVSYFASQNYGFIIKVPATKEARIIIESDGERIIKTNGYIFLHGI